MDMRDTRAAQLEQAPQVVVIPAPSGPVDDRPSLVPEAPPVARSRRGLLAGLAALVVLVLVLVGWLLIRGGDDSQVGTRTGAGAPGPAAVAPLTLTVDLPTAAVAGQPTDLVVHYADGAGVFGGSTEEWGDDVGTSSLAEDSCTPAPVTSALQGSYTATHTWAKAGTYPVKVAVSSYTCVNGAPVLEEATTTVTVQVAK